MPEAPPTRQRLLDVAMPMFADRGFNATSVGEIETAVGLQPRRGALYKHFPTKQALLEAAVKAKLDAARVVADKVSKLKTTDTDPEMRRPEMIALGHWFLHEMDQLEDLTRVFEHDADRLSHLIEEVRTEMVDLSYRSAAALIRALQPGIEDADATAVMMLAPLVALRRTQWTYGAPPLGIDDERALSEWASFTLARLDAARNGGSREPER